MPVNDVRARTHCRALNSLLTLSGALIDIVAG